MKKRLMKSFQHFFVCMLESSYYFLIIIAKQNTYCKSIGVEYMFINNSEQCDWIRQKFETPNCLNLPTDEKLLAWKRLLRSFK